jgi:hypothetical protein
MKIIVRFIKTSYAPKRLGFAWTNYSKACEHIAYGKLIDWRPFSLAFDSVETQ